MDRYRLKLDHQEFIMKIIGTNYETFFNATKAALAAFVGNDKIASSKVRKVLNLQFYPEQNIGENEHRLPELFQAQEAKEQELPTHANVVMLEHYENDDRGNILERVDTYICVGTDATDNKLKDLFESYYSEHADGSKILDAHMVERKIEALCWDEDGEYDDALDAMTEKVREFSTNEACEWLIENFDIDDLITNDFFGDFLNMDLYRIRYEHSDIQY